MNEVKRVCDAMLAEPEPAMRVGDEALSMVRRATRRRTTGRLISGGAGLAVLVTAALAAPSLLVGPTGATAPDRLADSAAPVQSVPNLVAAAQTTLPDLPTGEEVAAHGDQIYRVLSGAVPANYQAERRYGDDLFSLWYIAGADGDPASRETGSYVATAQLVLRSGGREGELAASVWGDQQAAPTADLCSAEVNTRMDPILGAAESCQVITVSGLPMRVTVHHDPEQLQIMNATWFVRNGFVTVSARQGLPTYQPDQQSPPDASNPGGGAPEYRPPLEQPVFTPQQLATIAANPDLLPE